MNDQAMDWVTNTAGQRIHGSTFAKPMDLFQTERTHLKPLPSRRPDVFWYAPAKVHNDCHVQFQRCFYSVPYRLIGQTVLLRVSAATLDVLHEEQMVANHILATKPGTKRTVEDHMPEPFRAWKMRAPQWCISQAEQIGPHCHALIRNIMGDKVVHRLRTVQGLLGLRKRYSDQQIEQACERCGIIDMITAKALTHVIQQMELEVKAGIPLGSGADEASTPAYEGRGIHARDPRALMTQ